jgi:hypothetical protein
MQLLNNFMVLELNNCRVLVSIAMVFGKYRECFFSSIVCYEPSGRFRKEQDKNHDQGGETSLHKGRNSPSPGCGEVSGGFITGSINRRAGDLLVGSVSGPSSENIA